MVLATDSFPILISNPSALCVCVYFTLRACFM